MHTGFSIQIGTKLRDWAVWQARAGCYSQAAMSSNDSKTLYILSTVCLAAKLTKFLTHPLHLRADVVC